jgi:hypothetical protein
MNFNGIAECCAGDNTPISGGNFIISPDLTSSVTASNFGIIQSVGSVNFNENSLGRVTQINAGTTSAFSINKANINVKMDNNLFEVDVNALPRELIDASTIAFKSPDQQTGLVIIDDAITLNTTTNGDILISTPGETRLACEPMRVEMSTTDVKIQNSGTSYTSATFNNNGITSQHLDLYDQTAAVGSYNPLFISANGLTSMLIENRTIADANAPYGFIGIGTNNFIIGRSNRSGGLPAPINQGGLTIAVNGYVDNPVGCTQRSRFITSNLYSENGAITVTNSTTETALYTIGIGSPQISINSENFKNGGILQFNCLFNAVTLSGVNSLRIRVRGSTGGITGVVLADSGAIYNLNVTASGLSVTINMFRLSATVIKVTIDMGGNTGSRTAYFSSAGWNSAIVNNLSLTAQMSNAIIANTFTYQGSSITMLG